MEDRTIALLTLIPSAEQSKFEQSRFEQSKFNWFTDFWRWAGGTLHRVWWHTHAYATVFGILLLTLLSLVVLYLHNQFIKRRFQLQWHPSTQQLFISTRRSE